MTSPSNFDMPTPMPFRCGDAPECHDGANPCSCPVDLTVCTDCIMIIANGIDEHDADQREHALDMWAFTHDWVGTFAPGDHITDFGTGQCDTCGTGLAGARYEAHLLPAASGASPSTGQVGSL